MESTLLLVSGKPGAGKSTASKLAASKIEGARHLSMGNRLRGISRDEISSQYSEGLRPFQRDLAEGKPSPPGFANLVLREFMDMQEGLVIFDGMPRYKGWAGDFMKMVGNAGINVIAICQIEVSNQVADARLAAREQRTPGVIEDAAFRAERIGSYYDTVLPVVADLRSIAPLYFVDGHQTPAEISDDLLALSMPNLAK